jgi:dipeptidyl aminopeptidase/acylaminoacyl peptidase
MRHSIRVTAAAGIALGLSHTGAAHAQSADTLPITTALSQPSFPDWMPISVSSDGGAVAYTVCAPDPQRKDPETQGFTKSGVMGYAVGCAVWIANTQTATATQVAGGPGTSAWAPQWSPDGRSVAFYSDRDGATRLWLWDAASETARRVSGVIVRPVTLVEGPRWTPDSRGIVTRVLPPGTTPEGALVAHSSGVAWDTIGRQAGSTVQIYTTDSAWRARPRLLPLTVSNSERNYESDLALVDAIDGHVRTLAHGFKPFAYWVSPDGRYVAFTSMHGATNNPRTLADYRYDVAIASISSGDSPPPRVIAEQLVIAPYGTGVVWSPNSASLAYTVTEADGSDHYYLSQAPSWHITSMMAPDSLRTALSDRGGALTLRWDPAGDAVYVVARTVMARIDLARGTTRILGRAPHGVSVVAFLGTATRSTAWLYRGGYLAVETRNDSTKRMGFATLRLSDGKWTQVTDEEQFLGSRSYTSSDVSADGRRLVYQSERATHPTDLWTISDHFESPRRITNTSPGLLGRHYGASRLIHWQTAAGQSVSGALLLPLGFDPGHRYPLVVYPYPLLDRSDHVFQFGLEGVGTENLQLYATRGIAILVPDVPIQVQDQMRSLANVILPGVERAIEIGVADSNRLGVMGHSWGGYTVLALLVQTTRFRAAVMRGAYGDMFADYGEIQATGSAFGQMRLESWLGVDPWHDLPRYIDNSPVFFLDRVRTPLLIVEGGAETTVPTHEATEVFADLRRLGQDVEYALYGGENHGEGGWLFANQEDFLARTLHWFETHLSDGRSDRPSQSLPAS